MEARYRTDYQGEFVVLETAWRGGKKEQVREWIPNTIENKHISARAACIGTDSDSYLFKYTILQRHRGGLLGSKKLQTYGTGEIAKTMRLDFTIECQPSLLEQLIEVNYHTKNIVYTKPKQCIKYPGFFYPIPYNLLMHPLTYVPYLAAFDGHKEIFLLGYHKDIPVENNVWIEQIRLLMVAYNDVKFYPVCHKHLVPDEWMTRHNVQPMDYREFISYCDV
jgi:hypothetical protein